MLSRVTPEQSCEQLFDRDEWQIVYKIRYRKNPPAHSISLKEMVNIIAGFGGHSDPESDRDPSIKTIW